MLTFRQDGWCYFFKPAGILLKLSVTVVKIIILFEIRSAFAENALYVTGLMIKISIANVFKWIGRASTNYNIPTPD